MRDGPKVMLGSFHSEECGTVECTLMTESREFSLPSREDPGSFGYGVKKEGPRRKKGTP